jgi:hypothetical protein
MINKKGACQKAVMVGCLCVFSMLALLSCTSNNQVSNQSNSNSNANAQPSASPVMPLLPQGFPTPVISGNIPVEITIPSTVSSPEQARPFFDYFSWESFIALNWPAMTGQRGVANQPDNPSTFLTAGSGYPSVWRSYRNALDLYDSGADRPPVWNSPDNTAICPGVAPGTTIFEMIQKDSSLLNNPNQPFSFPLIDQNKNYALYEMRFNQVQYDFIRGQDSTPTSWLYLLKNILNPVTMPAGGPSNGVGSLMLKASWREMTSQDQVDRYYVIDAQIYEPSTKTCRPAKMGLVGLHIVQKLTAFPEWIWSTFEQVDNVERGPGATQTTPISFNNGTNNPATQGGWANRPANQAPPLQPPDQRVPVQVTRFNPIPITPQGASTVDINRIYQQILAGTVWKNYQLVFTQWPTQPANFILMEKGGVYPQNSGSPFPVNGVTNTTLETYFQAANDAAGAGGNSCMQCHYRADSTDFSWSLNRRAH